MAKHLGERHVWWLCMRAGVSESAAWTCSVNDDESYSHPVVWLGIVVLFFFFPHARRLTPVIRWMYRSDFIFL